MRFPWKAGVCFLALVALSPVGEAATVNLAPTKDAAVRQGGPVFDGATEIAVRAADNSLGGVKEFGLFEFDLSGIPQHATITSVELEVTFVDVVSGSGFISTFGVLARRGADGFGNQDPTLSGTPLGSVSLSRGPAGPDAGDVLSISLLTDLLAGTLGPDDLLQLALENDSPEGALLAGLSNPDFDAANLEVVFTTPIPAALPLLLTGLGLLGWIAGRRRGTRKK